MIRTIVVIIDLFTSMMAALGSAPVFALSRYQIGYNDDCIVEPLKKCNCDVMKIDSILKKINPQQAVGR